MVRLPLAYLGTEPEAMHATAGPQGAARHGRDLQPAQGPTQEREGRLGMTEKIDPERLAHLRGARGTCIGRCRPHEEVCRYDAGHSEPHRCALCLQSIFGSYVQLVSLRGNAL